jgi:hypothetical protein
LLKAMENEKPEEFIPSKFEILPKTRKWTFEIVREL